MRPARYSVRGRLGATRRGEPPVLADHLRRSAVYLRLRGAEPHVAGLLEDADTPLQDALDDLGSDAPSEIVTALQPLARGDSPDTLETSGYVVHSLQTALHDGLFAESAEEAIVTAVNRGGDTDTIGAIAGAVAGARFGASQFPDRWVSAINEMGELEGLASQLNGLS